MAGADDERPVSRRHAAEVLSLDIEDAESVATIRYSGDSAELTLRTRWQDGTEHPVIVHIEPA